MRNDENNQRVSPEQEVSGLLRTFGPAKPMGGRLLLPTEPYFFLIRRFLSDIDLLVILNTKKCRCYCRFCGLSREREEGSICGKDIVEQFVSVCRTVCHSLSILDRVTISNEGSVLDKETLPQSALYSIVNSLSMIKSLRRIVLETRIELIDYHTMKLLQDLAPTVMFDILTGLETRSDYIRNTILRKDQTIEEFEEGLRYIAQANCALTSYVIFKPDPNMSDNDAKQEAILTIEYLREICTELRVPLTVRLNPMYAAKGTPWAEDAETVDNYQPSLADVLDVAEKAKASGIPTYIGLSWEGLAHPRGTYVAHKDFSREVFKRAKAFNDSYHYDILGRRKL